MKNTQQDTDPHKEARDRLLKGKPHALSKEEQENILKSLIQKLELK